MGPPGKGPVNEQALATLFALRPQREKKRVDVLLGAAAPASWRREKVCARKKKKREGPKIAFRLLINQRLEGEEGKKEPGWPEAITSFLSRPGDRKS